MPKRPSTADRFVKFLQGQLGEPVNIPESVTDVLRSTRFPGLEGRQAQDLPAIEPPNMELFDPSMLGGMPAPGIPEEEY